MTWSAASNTVVRYCEYDDHDRIVRCSGQDGYPHREKLRHDPDYVLLHVESGAVAEQRLRERGLEPCSPARAAQEADVVILAVPDVAIGRVAQGMVPSLRSGTMVICLDPAAPYSGELPVRADITYFVTHPCHPSIVWRAGDHAHDDTTPEARADFFGGVAKQSIVCALMQGPESDYARGEAICRRLFAPVLRAHRVTVEQMAILEPALSETVVLTCMTVMREALDEAIARGVPEQAAQDFILGHMNVNLGILFGFLNAQVSDGAKMAVQRARAAACSARTGRPSLSPRMCSTKSGQSRRAF